MVARRRRSYVRYHNTLWLLRYTLYVGGFLLPGSRQNGSLSVERQDLPARLKDHFCRFDDYTPFRLMEPLLKVFQCILLPDLNRPH